jgi:hypothetical protein
MTSTIRFYNHWGELNEVVTEIPTTPRSWVTNKYGRCEFSISTDDPACTERNLRFGNLVHVEHIPPTSADEGEAPSGKLPDWAGVILPPRSWDEGVVHVTAYSMEAILAYRAMPYISVSGPPGDVFRQIIEIANTRGGDNMPFTFTLGRVDTRDITVTDELKTNAYDHINKMVKTANMEWSITAKIVPESYALQFFANLIGRERSTTLAPTTGDALPTSTAPAILSLNSTNSESSNPLLTEQGTILNHLYAYSQSYTAADRAMQEIVYPASVSDYGPFQINTVFIGQTSEASLLEFIRGQTTNDSGNGRPAKLFKRIALNVGDTFSHLRTGALVEVVDTRVGFNRAGGFGFRSIARIVSMDYNDLTDKVNLNVEVLV